MHDQASIPLTMTRDEVRAFDAWAIRQLGLAGVVLMENAGRTCAELILRRLSGAAGAKVCLFCGAGNNGGDGFVIARHLASAGLSPTVVLCGNPDKIEGDAKTNLEVLRRMGQPIEVLDPAAPSAGARVEDVARGASLVVDALFGTGLRGEVAPAYVRLIEAINGLGREIVAVDIPSGLDCDTGRPSAQGSAHVAYRDLRGPQTGIRVTRGQTLHWPGHSRLNRDCAGVRRREVVR